MKKKVMLDAGHGGTASGTVHEHPTVKEDTEIENIRQRRKTEKNTIRV